jgi:hypothetical protein
MYYVRLLVIALATGGVLLSYVALDTCEFISFENQRGIPWENLEPPFDRAVSAHVGIFSYEILEAGVNGTTTGKCINYDDRFADMIDSYESIAASQFCAVVAPSLAMLAIALNLFEFFVCGFYGSFIVSSVLYFAAAGIQAGTFSMLAEKAIWYVTGQKLIETLFIHERGVCVTFFCSLLFSSSSVHLNYCFHVPIEFNTYSILHHL